MPDRHNLIESVRSYLLGTLDERQAEALELKYFSDPQFLQSMRKVEADLIQEYLNGRLSGAQKARFEQRYSAKIAQFREQQQRTRARPAFRWQYALGALILAAAAISPWLLSRWRTPANPGVILTIHLTPGVIKGASRQTEFPAPVNGLVRFSLELPGQVTPGDCVVTWRVVDDPARTWTSPVLHFADQKAEAEVDARLLRPGDYLAQAATTAGQAMETYSFRVLP